MSNEQMRAEFEAWFATAHECKSSRLFSRLIDDRRYESMEVEYAWLAYAQGRSTSGAASGEVVTVPREATEAMLHAAEDVPAPRTYGAVWRAMVGAAEQSAPPVPGMVKTWQERTDTRAMCLPLVAAMQEEIADLRALLATQSASTAPGQADWCPECHARESDGYEQELERDAARYRWLRESGEITASSTKGRIAIPMYTMTEKHKAELDAAIDSAIAALSKEKPL